MSIRVMTQVWDTSQQKGSALLLLLALADHAADDGFCWPGYEHLAQKIRMSTRSVSRLIEHLEKDGDLLVIRKQGEHNWYIVRVGMTDEEVVQVLISRKFATPANLSLVTLAASPQDTDDMGVMTQQCPPNLHEPSLNRQEEPPLADSPVEDSLTPDTGLHDTNQERLQRIQQCADPDGAMEHYEDKPTVEDSHPTHEDGIPLPPELWESRDEGEVAFWAEGETPPKPSPQEPVEQILPRLRDEYGIGPLGVAAVVVHHRAAVAHPDGGNPSKDGDPWVDIAVKEWARISGKDFKGMSFGTKLKLAGVFRKVGALADSGAVPVAAAIGRFPGEHKWWAEKVGFEWPSDNFCNKLGMMLVPDVEPEPQREFTFVDPDWLGAQA